MSANLWLLAFGAVCVVAALIGGQLKVGGIEFPVLRPVAVRLLLALIGAFLFALALGLIPQLSNAGSAPVSPHPESVSPAPPASAAKAEKTCENEASGTGAVAVCNSTVGSVSTNGGSSK